MPWKCTAATNRTPFVSIINMLASCTATVSVLYTVPTHPYRNDETKQKLRNELLLAGVCLLTISFVNNNLNLEKYRLNAYLHVNRITARIQWHFRYGKMILVHCFWCAASQMMLRARLYTAHFSSAAPFIFHHHHRGCFGWEGGARCLIRLHYTEQKGRNWIAVDFG